MVRPVGRWGESGANRRRDRGPRPRRVLPPAALPVRGNARRQPAGMTNFPSAISACSRSRILLFSPSEAPEAQKTASAGTASAAVPPRLTVINRPLHCPITAGGRLSLAPPLGASRERLKGDFGSSVRRARTVPDSLLNGRAAYCSPSKPLSTFHNLRSPRDITEPRQHKAWRQFSGRTAPLSMRSGALDSGQRSVNWEWNISAHM